MIICPRLPLELLYLVVRESDRRTLAVLMRTTRALSREAMPLFFASISIASTASLASLLRALGHGRLQSSWLRRLHLIHPPVYLPSFANVTSVRWTFSPSNAHTFLFVSSTLMFVYVTHYTVFTLAIRNLLKLCCHRLYVPGTRLRSYPVHC